jgi:hypothetical protein
MLMDQRAARPAIAAYLFHIATGRLGLPPEPQLIDRAEAAAEQLI